MASAEFPDLCLADPGSWQMARQLVVALCRDSEELTTRVVGLVRDKVSACIAHPLSMDLQGAVEGEMALLCDLCSSMDRCWEIKYRALMQVDGRTPLLPCVGRHVVHLRRRRDPNCSS